MLLEEDGSAVPGNRKTKLTDRAKMGCYSCGTTVSSRFRRWRASILAPTLEKIQAARPESEEICVACLEKHRSAMSSDEVRSFIAVHSVATEVQDLFYVD